MSTPMITPLPLLMVFTPLALALLLPILARAHRALAYVTFQAAALVSLVLASLILGRVWDGGKVVYYLGNWEPPFGIEYSVDALNGLVLVLIAGIAVLVSVYAPRSVAAEIPEEKHPFFFSMLLLLFTGYLGIVVTGDIFNMYVFIEISSLSSYTLIAMGRHREALTASYNYLILGTIGATFVLLGIGHLYMMTGSLNMGDLARLLPPLYHNRVILTAFALFTVGLSIKLALFPLHVWMPNAYTYAPSSVSAFIAATGSKVVAYVLLRVMFTVFHPNFDIHVIPLTRILLVLASLAIIMGSVLAMAQTNIKRMLAYSSVGQIGYIVLGAALVNRTGMTGALIHIVNHALMKLTLFMAVGIVIVRTGIETVEGLKGMGKKLPVTMAAFSIAALSMIGVPLTVGFVSKWYLAVGALETGMWYLVAVILLSSGLNAVYFWRVIDWIYFSKPGDALAKVEAREAPWSMLVPLLVAAALCVVFGVQAQWPASVANHAAGLLVGGAQ